MRWLYENALVSLRTLQARFPSSNAYNDLIAAGGSPRPWMAERDLKLMYRHLDGRRPRSPRSVPYSVETIALPSAPRPNKYEVSCWLALNGSETAATIVACGGTFFFRDEAGRACNRSPRVAALTGKGNGAVGRLDRLYPDLTQGHAA